MLLVLPVHFLTALPHQCIVLVDYDHKLLVHQLLDRLQLAARLARLSKHYNYYNLLK